MTLRIDAHHHFWQPARGDYGWLRADVPAVAPLVRDYLPGELVPLMKTDRVAQTVLIQAAPTEAETEYLLGLASAHDFIGGVVGWVDLSRADCIPALQRWAAHPRFKGVRPMLQDLPEHDWIARAPDPRVIAELVRLGLRFDALVQPWHLAPLRRFLETWPALPAVIDHVAKPQLACGWSEPWAATWRRDLAALAAMPQVACKWSGLLTEAGSLGRPGDGRRLSLLRPVWEVVMESFGPHRLMWGSDWPVLTLADSYGGWIELTESLASELASDERASIWHGTAMRFYDLSPSACKAPASGS